MAIQGSAVAGAIMDGHKWHYYHISNGFVTPRRGKVIARWVGPQGWDGNYYINASGVTVAQYYVGGGSYGYTVMADVPAGVTVETGGRGNLEYFVFQEF